MDLNIARVTGRAASLGDKAGALGSLVSAMGCAMCFPVQALGWLAHRQWHRTLAGMIGPSLVLLSLYPWWQYGWSTWTFYGGWG